MTKLTVLILSLIAFGCSQSNNPIEFYVDVTGNDSNQGTLEAPFKTIEQAKNAIRALSEQQRQKNINVYLRAGTHTLSETIVFELEDSGADKTKITYQAYQNEIPIISSGVPLKNWKKLESYPAALPEVAKGNVYVTDIPDGLGRFYTMFDGDKRIPVARKEGFDFKNINYVRSKSMNVLHEKDRYLLRRLELTGGKILKS